MLGCAMLARMSTHHVVVLDPRNEYWEGALVDVETAGALRARRVVTLPIEPELVRRSAIGGYFRRSWGSGWPIGTKVPKMHCPMVLFVAKGDGLRNLHWAARLVPESPEIARLVGEGGHLTGTLQLTGDSGQPAASSGGFLPGPGASVNAALIGPLDEDGGWTVYGTGLIEAPVDEIFSCALYGAVAGMRVAWAAISQSR
jgi:hypothetical protein